MRADVQEILSGPRGRRLCLEVARTSSSRVRELTFWLGHQLDPEGSIVVFGGGAAGSTPSAHPVPEFSTKDIVQALQDLDPSPVPDEWVRAGLVESVAAARYWQKPDGEDLLAADAAVMAALEPLAQAVLESGPAQTWTQPCQPEQWLLDWSASETAAGETQRGASALAAWAQATRAEETRAHAERPEDPEANFSGVWWSAPQGIIRTVARIPSALDLIEDSAGEDTSMVIPMSGSGKTYEIRSPEDWVQLCLRFPLEVSASRRHDWYRVTGRAGRWVIPDWERVASEWDGVHLTTFGYLGAAGRALSVSDGVATLLAGWDPDATIWLTEALSESEAPPQQWHRDLRTGAWTRCQT